MRSDYLEIFLNSSKQESNHNIGIINCFVSVASVFTLMFCPVCVIAMAVSTFYLLLSDISQLHYVPTISEGDYFHCIILFIWFS